MCGWAVEGKPELLWLASDDLRGRAPEAIRTSLAGSCSVFILILTGPSTGNFRDIGRRTLIAWSAEFSPRMGTTRRAYEASKTLIGRVDRCLRKFVAVEIDCARFARVHC